MDTTPRLSPPRAVCQKPFQKLIILPFLWRTCSKKKKEKEKEKEKEKKKKRKRKEKEKKKASRVPYADIHIPVRVESDLGIKHCRKSEFAD